MSQTVLLPAAVVGPQSQGRRYGVLHRSPGLELGAADARLQDFSLGLAEWADRRDRTIETFTAFFRLSDSLWAFAKARFLGQAELGTVAIAHLVFLGLKDEALLAQSGLSLVDIVPTPSGGVWRPDAVEAPAKPPTGPRMTREPASLQPFAAGLDLGDRLAEVRGGVAPEAVVGSILAAYGQGPIGWATTASLPATGALDPAKLFGLVAYPAGDPVSPGLAGRAKALVAEGELAAPETGRPPARRVWDVLVEGRSKAPRPVANFLARFSWRREYAGYGADALPGLILAPAAQQDASGDLTFDLIDHFAQASEGLDLELRESVRLALARAFQASLPTDPTETARRLAGYLHGAGAALGGAMPLMPAVAALETGAIAHLDLGTAQALSREGLAVELQEDVRFALPTLQAPALAGLILGAAQAAGEETGDRRERAQRVLKDAVAEAVLHTGYPADGDLVRAVLAGVGTLATQAPNDALFDLFAILRMDAFYRAAEAPGGRAFKEVKARLMSACVGQGFDAPVQDEGQLVRALSAALSLVKEAA